MLAIICLFLFNFLRYFQVDENEKYLKHFYKKIERLFNIKKMVLNRTIFKLLLNVFIYFMFVGFLFLFLNFIKTCGVILSSGCERLHLDKQFVF